MTEFSYPWGCTVAGDGGATSFSLAIVEDTNKFLSNIAPAENGVVYWTTSPLQNLLAPSNPSGSTVRISTGVGIVEGWIYTNDTNVDFDINASPGNANATDIIVLRRDLVAQTVRLARIGGAAASKAVLTQTAATWEVPIADVVLDGAGNFSSLVDARKLAIPAGSRVKLDEFEADGVLTSMTFSGIPPLFNNLYVVARARSTVVATEERVNLRFNNDSGNNYDWESNRSPGTGTNDTKIDIMEISAASATANYFDTFHVVIAAITDLGYKSLTASGHAFRSGGAGAVLVSNGGWWQNTAAINRIDIFLPSGAFVTGSRVTLYGEI